MPRGAFIVVEGLDGSGKTTLVRRLAHSLQDCGFSAKQWHFPNRSTETGKLLDRFLKKEIVLNTTAAHCVFVANFHEDVPRLEKFLSEGTTIICDRYVYSGMAYSSGVTQTPLSDWQSYLKALPKPDLVLFLEVLPEIRELRLQHRLDESELYDRLDVQRRVERKFTELVDTSWKIIPADGDETKVHSKCVGYVTESMSAAETKFSIEKFD